METRSLNSQTKKTNEPIRNVRIIKSTKTATNEFQNLDNRSTAYQQILQDIKKLDGKLSFLQLNKMQYFVISIFIICCSTRNSPTLMNLSAL